MTISGAISLGAYEAGALAALLTAVQANCADQTDPPLRVDAIGGASAGSITAVLAARILLGGVDPIDTMQAAWVDRARLSSMFRGAWFGSPLNIKNNLKLTEDLFDPAHDSPERRQMADVRVSLAISNLRGLDYGISRLSSDGKRKTGVASHTIHAATYLDWQKYLFAHDPPRLDQFRTPRGASPLNYALASGSNEFGFAPYWLDRASRPYRDAGLSNYPTDSKGFWFTDGGTVDNEPLGRTIDLTAEVDAPATTQSSDFRRLHLLIHPHPVAPAPSQSKAWANDQNRPYWSSVLLRGLSQQRYQSLYADMDRAEKVNSHILWMQELVDKIKELVPESEQPRWQEELETYVGQVDSDKTNMRKSVNRSANPVPVEARSFEDALWSALARASGIAGKKVIGIESVSPLLLIGHGDKTTKVEDLLAGELLGAFGGFLDIALRQSDFLLGYQSMRIWLKDGLIRYGLDSASVEAAHLAVAQGEARVIETTKTRCGGKTNLGRQTLLGELPRHSWPLIHLALKIPALIAIDGVRRLFGAGAQ